MLSLKLHRYLLVALLLGATNLLYAQTDECCPTNFTGKQLAVASKSPQQWNDKVVAFDMEVMKVVDGYEGAPYFLGKLDDGSTVWVGTLVISGYIEQGRKLRIIGYFKPLLGDDLMKDVNKEGYHVMAFAVRDLETGAVGIWPRENDKVQQWFDGNMPE